MGIPVRAPRSMLLRKPPHGEPCTRCGLCCYVVLCNLAQHIFEKEAGPCPALLMGADGKSSCGLTQTAEPYRSAALTIIGAGDGCDARFNGEPINEAFNDKLTALDRLRKDQLKAAGDLWGLQLKEESI